MVSDLQGVRYDSKYVLTDPAILSLEGGNYGSTDLSLVGMGLFFLSHQCTDVCRSLACMESSINGPTCLKYIKYSGS